MKQLLILLLLTLTACSNPKRETVEVPVRERVVCNDIQVEAFDPLPVVFTPVLGADVSGQRDVGPNTPLRNVTMWIGLSSDQYENLSINTERVSRIIQQLVVANRSYRECLDNYNSLPATVEEVLPNPFCRQTAWEVWKPRC